MALIPTPTPWEAEEEEEEEEKVEKVAEEEEGRSWRSLCPAQSSLPPPG